MKKDLPIRKKLRYSMLSTAGWALLVLLIINTGTGIYNTRSALINHINGLAEFIGLNSSAALIFDDRGYAIRLLSGLKTEPEVVSATLYTETNHVFAEYNRKISDQDKFSKIKALFLNNKYGSLDISQPILVDGRNYGKIHIKADQTSLINALIWQIFNGLFGVIIAIVVAYILSLRLQKQIANPILNLAETMIQISRQQSFERRLKRPSNDELGELYERFNEMIYQIQLRDARLNRHRQHLETEVSLRTKDLNRSNKELKIAIKQATAAKEAALEAAKAKSTFLANMSHEIRTPMNGVLGMLELLDSSKLNPPQDEFVRVAHSSAEALLEIINDVLDITKIDAGKMDIEHIETNLSDIAYDVVSLLAPKAREKKLELACLTDIKVPAAVLTDPLRLRQILINLLGNGIKFTEAGEILLEIKVVEQKNNKSTIAFIIKDTGIGINNEQMSKLFKAFTQADSATTRRFGGTGLGLTISQQLVQLMGGQLKAESRLHEGSTFSFILSLDHTKSTPKLPHNIDLAKNVHALIVDDNKTNRDILHYYLNAWEIRHESVTSGEEALLRLQKNAKKTPINLVYLDMDMPVMDGIMLCKRIKKEVIPLPKMIMLTSSGYITQKRQQALGLSGCLLKPYKQSQLLELTQSILTNTPRKKRPALPQNVNLKFERPMHILLTEDNLVNQKVALNMLKKIDVLVDVANDGVQAVSMVGQKTYDLVLMDCQMAVMSGYEATTLIRIRERIGGFAHLPIIALTAHAMAGDKEKCFAAGMDDYITKPIKIDKLEKLLQHWLIKQPSLEDANPSIKVPNKHLDQLQIVQEQVLEKNMPECPEEREKFLNQFEQKSTVLLNDINMAISQADLSVASLAGLNLKECCKTVGAEKMAFLTEYLNSKGPDRTAALINIYARLVVTRRNTITALREWLQKQPAA